MGSNSKTSWTLLVILSILVMTTITTSETNIFIKAITILLGVIMILSQKRTIEMICLIDNKIKQSNVLKQMLTKRNYKKTNIKQTDFPVLDKGADKEFLRNFLEVLQEMPNELKTVLKKEPIFFVTKKDQENKRNYVGQYGRFFSINKIPVIIMWSKVKECNQDKAFIKEIVYHEICHHLDTVMKKELNGGKAGFYSVGDGRIKTLLKENKLDIHEHYLEDEREYYAETLKMYICGEKITNELKTYHQENITKLRVKMNGGN